MGGCWVPGCTNRGNAENGIHMKRFPKDPDEKAIWIKNIGRVDCDPTDSTQICQVSVILSNFISLVLLDVNAVMFDGLLFCVVQRHFTSDCYEIKDGHCSWKRKVVPTLYLCQPTANSRETGKF